METLDQLREAWNVEADAMNTWDDLGLDEIVHFAQARAAQKVGGILRGCRDMLRESAKQHRLAGESGHSKCCDMHADVADKALSA